MDRFIGEKEICGRSFWGQPISCRRLGEGKTALLFSGDFGGDDRCSGVIERFAKELSLCGQRDEAPVGKVGMGRLLMVRTAFLVPCPNPDAHLVKTGGPGEESPFYPRVQRLLSKRPPSQWTANGRGVEVGRNFNYGYADYRERCVGKEAPFGYCGAFPESEPESACFAALARRVRPRLFVHLTAGPSGLLFDRRHGGLDGLCSRYAPFERREIDLSATPEGWILRELGCAYLRIFLGTEDEERSYRLLCPLLFALMAY